MCRWTSIDELEGNAGADAKVECTVPSVRDCRWSCQLTVKCSNRRERDSRWAWTQVSGFKHRLKKMIIFLCDFMVCVSGG